MVAVVALVLLVVVLVLVALRRSLLCVFPCTAATAPTAWRPRPRSQCTMWKTMPGFALAAAWWAPGMEVARLEEGWWCQAAAQGQRAWA